MGERINLHWKPSEESLRASIAFCASVVVMALGSFTGWSSLFWACTGFVAFAALCLLVLQLAREDRRLGFQIGLRHGAETTEPHLAIGHAIRTQGFFVREAKGQPIDDASVYLEKLWTRAGWHSPLARVALATDGQFRESRHEGRINFAPHEEKRILLCGLDETKPGRDITLFYANKDLPNRVPQGEYFARIRIVGGARPARAVFRIWVDEGGTLCIALHHVR